MPLECTSTFIYRFIDCQLRCVAMKCDTVILITTLSSVEWHHRNHVRNGTVAPSEYFALLSHLMLSLFEVNKYHRFQKNYGLSDIHLHLSFSPSLVRLRFSRCSMCFKLFNVNVNIDTIFILWHVME